MSSSWFVPPSELGSSKTARCVSLVWSVCLWMSAELLMRCESNLPGGRCDVRLHLPCACTRVCVCVCAAIKRQHKLQSCSHRFTPGLKAKGPSHTAPHPLAFPSLCPSFSVEQHSFSFPPLPVSLGSSRCPKLHTAPHSSCYCAARGRADQCYRPFVPALSPASRRREEGGGDGGEAEGGWRMEDGGLHWAREKL